MAHWLQNLYLPLLLSEAPPAALEFALDEGGRLPQRKGHEARSPMITTSGSGEGRARRRGSARAPFISCYWPCRLASSAGDGNAPLP